MILRLVFSSVRLIRVVRWAEFGSSERESVGKDGAGSRNPSSLGVVCAREKPACVGSQAIARLSRRPSRSRPLVSVFSVLNPLYLASALPRRVCVCSVQQWEGRGSHQYKIRREWCCVQVARARFLCSSPKPWPPLWIRAPVSTEWGTKKKEENLSIRRRHCESWTLSRFDWIVSSVYYDNSITTSGLNLCK